MWCCQLSCRRFQSCVNLHMARHAWVISIHNTAVSMVRSVNVRPVSSWTLRHGVGACVMRHVNRQVQQIQIVDADVLIDVQSHPEGICTPL